MMFVVIVHKVNKTQASELLSIIQWVKVAAALKLLHVNQGNPSVLHHMHISTLDTFHNHRDLDFTVTACKIFRLRNAWWNTVSCESVKCMSTVRVTRRSQCQRGRVSED